MKNIRVFCQKKKVSRLSKKYANSGRYDEARAKTPKVYDVGVTCKQHWRKMAKKMLEPWAGVRRPLGRVKKSV